ncbi:MAG: hypothetical protein JWN86_4058, partial [Planctomycetota bacterium]|nr:hypothetical protein [Planctomycetota bacterium]
RLLGDFALYKTVIILLFINNMRMLFAPDKLLSVPEDLLDKAKTGADAALNFYHQAGFLVGELRAKMLLADFHELGGDLGKAKKLAAESQDVAQVMEFAGLEAHFSEQAAGNSLLSRIEARVMHSKTADIDELIAGENDAKMVEFANANMQALDLPSDRFPVVLRECHAMRTESQEKLGWCRHLCVIQDLRHMERHQTQYLFDPERFGACDRFGHRANIGSIDVGVAIRAFKGTYCEGCKSRSPKATNGGSDQWPTPEVLTNP